MLEREDEIGCAVGGCNFLLRTITHEAFVFEAGQAQFVPCTCECWSASGCCMQPHASVHMCLTIGEFVCLCPSVFLSAGLCAAGLQFML